MKDFFSLYTLTPWDGLNTDNLTRVKLLSLKSILTSYPVIRPEFLDDLISNLYNEKHFSYIQSIKRIQGPGNEDYDISHWNFIWAMDKDRRMFQFLIQKEKETESSQSVMAALAPPELAKLIQDHKKEAIHRILSLINSPKQINFLIVLAPKGKSIAQEQQPIPIKKELLKNLQLQNYLSNIPNIQGQWFPSFAPKCPICNVELVGMENYQIGFGKMICPRCGYKKL